MPLVLHLLPGLLLSLNGPREGSSSEVAKQSQKILLGIFGRYVVYYYAGNVRVDANWPGRPGERGALGLGDERIWLGARMHYKTMCYSYLLKGFLAMARLGYLREAPGLLSL